MKGEGEKGNPQGETSRGYLYAVVGAVCAGSVTALTKMLLADDGPPVTYGLAYGLSGLLLLLYRPKVMPASGSLRYLLFFGVVGAAIAPLMYAYGLSQTTAVNAALLANGEVLFTAIVAFSIFGERLERAQTLRGLIIVAGLVIVSTNLDLAHISFLQGLVGNVLILGSTVGWAFENNLFAIATRRFDVTTISKFRNLLGGGAMLALALLANYSFIFSPFDVAVLILLTLAIAGSTLLFIAAIKRLGAVRMLLVWSASTVFGALFALVFLGEQITLTQVAGGVCILLGVYLFTRSEGPVPGP